MSLKLVKSSIRCRSCNQIITSRTVHDFQGCPCGKVAVDGGSEYQKILGNPTDYESLTIWAKRGPWSAIHQQITAAPLFSGGESRGRERELGGNSSSLPKQALNTPKEGQECYYQKEPVHKV